ncbi:DUF2513 domain-containing protein [Phenylobacterium immobile]|uniref:DUF2513 domain-containing protein n=1 Tax=Phenylobacterium immobile TaxID=21 RepID=UPI000B331550|nr:DUF2513 domain-containing protein [Phenylobacterium immobile]
MLRDVELAKTICQAIGGSHAEMDADAISIEGQPPWKVSRHVELMVQAGLIDASPGPRAVDGQKVYRVRSLTPYGAEFAHSLKAADVWARLEDLFPGETIQQIPLRVIAGLAPRMIKP